MSEDTANCQGIESRIAVPDTEPPTLAQEEKEQRRTKKEKDKEDKRKQAECWKTIRELVPNCSQLKGQEAHQKILTYLESSVEKFGPILAGQVQTSEDRDLKTKILKLVPPCKEIKNHVDRLNAIINYIRSIPQTEQEGMVPANAASLMPEQPQVIGQNSRVISVSGLESQGNANEASRDASLQGQEPPHNNERETESSLNGNEDDEDEPCDPNGMSGYRQSASSEKRKQREEMSSVDVNDLLLLQAENTQLKEKYEQLKEENTGLKEEVEKWKKECDKLLDLNFDFDASDVPDEAAMEETVPELNAASSMPEGAQEIAEISGPTHEATTRDLSLQVQDSTPIKEKETEALLLSNEEAKHGTCASVNESDEAESSSGGDEDDGLSDRNDITSDPSATTLSSKKRKRSEEEAEDAIKDASDCKFSVNFAMDTVKKIASALIKFNKSIQVRTRL